MRKNVVPSLLAQRVSSRFENKLALLTDAVRYLGASVLALGADFGTLLVLHRGVGLHYLVAAPFAFVVGLIVAWVLSTAFVFSGRRKLSPTREFGGFALIGFAGLAVTQLVLLAFVDGFGSTPEAAKVAAAGTTFAFNFVSRRALLFASPIKAPA